MTGRRIAAFDFDGTLTRRDTLVPFLATSCGPGAFIRALGRVAPTALRARTGRTHGAVHPRDAGKAALLRELYADRRADWLASQGQKYAATLTRRLRPEMVEQVRWHREAGHELVIVSAGLRTYLEPFAADAGFDHVIAVELEADDAGVLTGELQGPNVRGPEKAVRLRRWLGDDQPEMLWAYGNSSGDTELLAMADVPVWVAGRKRDTTARPEGAGGRVANPQVG
ncbi:HAD-IB family hydrolase [Aquihabitans sp. McL0605]|uniref:HAD-IB family hydrolase n=1 Tax=Aquihabitans sp. McL0605 TaxID=3415671 RepID=UPI003CF0B6ED